MHRRVILSDHIKKRCERTLAQIEWLIHLEDRPFTLNTHYLADYKDKFLTYYRTCRYADTNTLLMDSISAPVAADSAMGKTLAGLAEVGLTGVQPCDLPKLLPPDAMAPALGIMADVRAYFQGKLCLHSTH